MGISDQRISQKMAKKELSAMQLFTDREDPQEAFERKLALIDEDFYSVLRKKLNWGVGPKAC